MLDSFKAVKRNRGAAGIDKVSIQMFEANLAENLQALMRELKDGSFQPSPVAALSSFPRMKRSFAPSAFQPSEIAWPRRLFAACCRRSLNPCFMTRPTAFARDATATKRLEAALRLHDQGFEFVLDADIKGFFDNLSHPSLWRRSPPKLPMATFSDSSKNFLPLA